VLDGGVLDLQSGGAAQGELTFAAGGGTLLLDGGTAGAVVAGFSGGDTILLGARPAGMQYDAANYVATFDGGGTITFDAATAPAALAYDAATGALVACFAAGTRIATPTGERAVESLRAGDRVRRASRGTAPVVWLGHRRIDCRRHPRPHEVWPVRIAPHAFGRDRPRRELLLSPDHAVHVRGVLLPVRYLVNSASIAQIAVDAIDYWHLELPAHAVILAEGLGCESYLDTGNRSAFDSGCEAPDSGRAAVPSDP